MRHDFTRDQINAAILEMPMMECNSGVAQWEYAMFSQFLDALPDPAPVADEWEQCDFEDIQKGDQFKIVSHDWETTGTLVHEDADILGLYPVSGTMMHISDVKRSQGIEFYRIPAPVQHPDPEKHPLIYCSDLVMDFFWDRRTEAYVSIGDTAFSQDPEDFANWTPARIVPAGDD